MKIIRLSSEDNVAVAAVKLAAGEKVKTGDQVVTVAEPILPGHKLALEWIGAGQSVIKYGYPIGTATADIRSGSRVHTHNLHSSLDIDPFYTYRPVFPDMGREPVKMEGYFAGYRRKNGTVGIRNELWIIPTVGCVNRIAELIRKRARKLLAGKEYIEGIYEFKHPYGCSQVGEDHAATRRILVNLARHPNAGGVLILGLGCENNRISEMEKELRPYNPHRIKFLVAQESDDEVTEGVRLLEELADYASTFRRRQCPISELVVGLKCGGSDAFSGITANPLVGLICDRLTAGGGTAVLSEVPEMFGAETILMSRAGNENVFKEIVDLINDYKSYYRSAGRPVYENPSPGNLEGGITTLEEKSLGCVQKGGIGPVRAVIPYGGMAKTRGLNLLGAPGNDAVSTTALAAAGCQMILFTTGRGTPFGTSVPTYKIASTSGLTARKPGWIDFNAGCLLEGTVFPEACSELEKNLLQVASGSPVKAELMGFREIAILKRGVTL
ncbi:MAG: altronate dehydratase family protein [Bacillota bacterium]|nr:altronate dehydratase family protein [Bacillota bacterium]